MATLCSCRPAPQQPVRIGLIAYRDEDFNGPSTRNAVQLAVDQVNREGGLRVGGVLRRVEIRPVVTTEDSPEEAVAATQQLINQEQVCAILGPQNSDEAIPAGALAERAGIPLLTPISSLDQVTRGRAFVFRACYRDEDQGKALARFAMHTLKARTAGLLVEVNIAYSRAVAEVFRREYVALGGRIVFDGSFTTQARTDLGRQFRQIRGAAPQVLLLPNYSPRSALMSVATRAAGIRATFLGADAWSRQRMRGVPEFDGAYMVTNWSPELPSPANLRFLADYSQRFGVEANETAALTYDATRMLLAAIARTANAEPQAIQRALLGLQDFEGASGRIRFKGSGDPEKDVVVLKFTGGRDGIAHVIPAGARP